MSRSGCHVRHCRRAAATSGRRCSSACTVFFNGEAQALDRPPQRAQARGRRQRVAQLGERGIGPRGDQRRQPVLLTGEHPPAETWFAAAARSSPSPAAAASARPPRPDSRDTARPTPSTTAPRPHPSIRAPANPWSMPPPSPPPRRQEYHGRVLSTSEKRSSRLGTLRRILEPPACGHLRLQHHAGRRWFPCCSRR